jgi:pilus assembly protein CpaF
MFVQAVDVIVQVGWRDSGRQMLGIWEVEKELKAGNVKFRQLYKPGDAEMLAPSTRSMT